MKNNLCVLLIIFSLVLWQRELMAQMKKAREITGTVEDERSLPLPGVTVRIKNVNLGTATDQEGRYRLKVPVNMEKFTLVFSFIGMASREIVYQGKDTIHVVLREEKHELEEVIVNTGYERINLRKSTSAIQSIKAKDIVFPGLSSIDQMLEGYVPGLIYMQNSGQVGVSPRLSIRGTSTILGSREPVWVINGIVQESPVNIDPRMINDLDFVNLLGNAVSGLNPEDIKQIDILKDASATALYGARAANGVIVITTKKGKTGPPSFSYSFNGTFRKRPYYSDHEVNMMNSAERVDFSRELLEKSHEEAADRVEECLQKGQNVVFLTLGDPTVYSTYLYVHKRIAQRGYRTELTSGITSFCAVAAKLNIGLVEKAEELHVIPASYQIEDALKLPGTKVLMKAGRKIGQVKELLKKAGMQAMMIENCGMENEKIYQTVDEIPENAGYYSLIIVKEN